MACKLFSKLIVVSLILAVIFIENASAQRRRRPSTTTESDSDVSPVPVFPPRFSHQRRMNTKALNKQGNKSVQSDIAESCKSEPGCEWSCSETDVYDCTCRCKFDPAAFSQKNQNARFH